MERSIFAFATDLHGEGLEAVLDNVQRRAGLDAITVATVYHDARDLFPHNPQSRMRFLEPGATYFRPDPSRYEHLKLQPRVSRLVEAGDVIADLVHAAARRGVAVHAWTVYLHTDWLRDGSAEQVERNAFGDPFLTELCPANPDVRAYVVALTGDIARLGVSSIVAESLHYHPLEHGYHHERYFLPLGAVTRFLLGLCFCEHCLAAARAHGCDAKAVRRFAQAEIQRVFDGAADTSVSLEEAEARALAGGELGAFLDARAERVASLVGEAAAAAEANGARFTFMDASGAIKGYADGLPTGGPATEIAWRLGVDLQAIAQACGRLEAIAYAAQPERVALDLSAYRRCLPPDGALSAAMRPTLPDCDSAANLAEKLSVARELRLERVDFYHYGFAPLSVLDRIREAIEAEPA